MIQARQYQRKPQYPHALIKFCLLPSPDELAQIDVAEPRRRRQRKRRLSSEGYLDELAPRTPERQQRSGEPIRYNTRSSRKKVVAESSGEEFGEPIPLHWE
jgi:hypothetical protein